VGSENRDRLRRALADGCDPAAPDRSGAYFLERAAGFLERLCASASLAACGAATSAG
jgi:hypothetical protein